MKEAISSELGKLVGLKLQCAGRASNLFWLGFGEMISVTRKGKTEELAEYALDIQSSWRIIKENKILVASRDFYSPWSGWNEDNENFDWDIQGNNRFDERIKYFLEAVQENCIVESIDSDNVGGFKVFLSEGFVFEVFPDTSEDDEYSEFWRFFNRKDGSPHFVVTGNGIDKV
ncbi:hypothetical protein [Bacillus sp. AFS031507]|uniref:hypothetical protein n=1 Tax=Bacillus sp. AFS031507 TaxID=2033496 RepID=UPI000BFD5005|nr:hypothetical protein [Bacillus sp. AFS031507]PGY07105.1 hypothetical protein COE25_25190 [Bacillus sp. AFS031507]